MDDPFNLQRFVDAQAAVYATVLQEIRRGRKRSHWMWFIFPQLEGLGFSPTSRHFAIGSAAEAVAYLEHPVLGSRLRECTVTVSIHEGKTAREIFGWPDDLKFRSSMTLFQAIAPTEEDFTLAIDRFYGGQPDRMTLSLLQQTSSG